MRRALDIAVTALLPLAALVVLVLSARGTFRGATTFPPIFAAVVVVIGLASLMARRRSAQRWHTALVVVGMLLSLGAVWAHHSHLARERRAAEREGMAALADGPAPEIPYSHAVHGAPDAPNPISFDGAWTVVNFWATWCDPCREEMPSLERFWQEHRGEGMRVVGVTRLWGEEDEASVRGELGAIERFVAEVGVTYPIVVSDAGIVEAWGVRSWPSSILIGPDGRAVSYGVGIDGAEELLSFAETLSRRR